MLNPSPFRCFKTSHEIIRLAVMMYVRLPFSLREVEDLLHERRIEVSHETVRCWWNRFGVMSASGLRKKCIQQLQAIWKDHERNRQSAEEEYRENRARRKWRTKVSATLGWRYRDRGIAVNRDYLGGKSGRLIFNLPSDHVLSGKKL